VRGAWLGKQIDDEQFDRLTDRIAAQDLDVWPTAPLLPRIRQLAANATARDAAYLALAEEIGSPLVTADAKFSRVPGIQCRVIGA
jgi:predicted nucleic acid-binding protein